MTQARKKLKIELFKYFCNFRICCCTSTKVISTQQKASCETQVESSLAIPLSRYDPFSVQKNLKEKGNHKWESDDTLSSLDLYLSDEDFSNSAENDMLHQGSEMDIPSNMFCRPNNQTTLNFGMVVHETGDVISAGDSEIVSRDILDSNSDVEINSELGSTGILPFGSNSHESTDDFNNYTWLQWITDEDHPDCNNSEAYENSSLNDLNEQISSCDDAQLSAE